MLLACVTCRYFWFCLRWFIEYKLWKKDYKDEDKVYLICKNLHIKQGQWDLQTDRNKYEFMRRELWIKENAKVCLSISYIKRY